MSALPALIDPGTTIDGYTQPGSSPNTDPLVSNAAITIEVRGLGQQDGTASFSVTSPGNTFRGIAAYNAFYDIKFANANADANTVVGSFIGTNAAGTAALANGGYGINVYEGGVVDMKQANVVEPMRVVEQAIQSATETAIMILRIDDVISSKGVPMDGGMGGMGDFQM